MFLTNLSRAQFGQAQVQETTLQFAVISVMDSRSDWHLLTLTCSQPLHTCDLWSRRNPVEPRGQTRLCPWAQHCRTQPGGLQGDAETPPMNWWGKSMENLETSKGYHGFDLPAEFPTWLPPEFSDYFSSWLSIIFPTGLFWVIPFSLIFAQTYLGVPPIQKRGVELQFVGAGLCPTHWPANWSCSKLCSVRVGLGGRRFGGATVWYSAGGSTGLNMINHA